jgi:heme oxygenase
MKTGTLSKSLTIDTNAASFLHKIKQSTAALHLRLESQALFSAIMLPSVTRLHYYYYLILMKKIEDAYEKGISAPLAGTFAQFEKRKASQLISEDLNHIGNIAPQSFTSKDFTIPSEKISIPFSMGFQYVMKGSKLGGKVIYRHIYRTLGYSDKGGAKFIADSGVDTFRLWKEFLSKFSMYVIQNDCEAEAIQGAEWAFSSIHDFFELNRLAYEI